MRHLTFFIILMLGALIASPAKPKRTSKDVRRDRQRTEQQIQATQKQIKQNSLETSRQLDRLNTIQHRINLQNDTIQTLRRGLDSINASIAAATDSLTRLKERTDALRRSYAHTLRQIRTRRQSMSDLAFIFSAETFGQAWSRARHMQQTARLHKVQARRLAAATATLDSARIALEALRQEQQARLGTLNSSRQKLAGEQASADAVVKDLRKQSRNLDRELRRRRDRAAALDRELDRVIQQEIRAAEERRRREEEARRAAEEKARREAEAKARREAEAKKAAENPASPTPPAATPPTPSKPPTPAAKPTKPAKPATQPTREAESDRVLSGSFSANKGRLLFPVAGKYTVVSGFGTSSHPELSKIKVDNLGIDIEVAKGAAARAVFQGVVSSIFRMEGYDNVVIVRHGSYLTVYAGLASLSVKKGDAVRAGQTLGTVHLVDGHPRLHFEIRHEKQKLNPIDWVR